MAVIAALHGAPSGEAFLIAPHEGREFPARLSLRTDTGSAAVTLRSVPDGRLIFSPSSCEVGTVPTEVSVHATEAGAARGDTAVEVVQDGTVLARVDLTCLGGPIVVGFRGRFEARFATDTAPYNDNPAYTADPGQDEDVAAAPGWTWGLEGEPPFVPPNGNVPERIETPVGRQIRFNDPVALRPRAAAVVTVVDRISGRTAAGTETFTSGDPLIGEQVNVGQDTYFAGNRRRNPADPRTEESYRAQNEVLGLFELHLGARFSGASAIGPFTHQASAVDEHTRVPDSRPRTVGFGPAAAELAEFGLPGDVTTFSDRRIEDLLADYAAAPGDTAARRNLRRRICHLLPTVSAERRAKVIAAAEPNEFDERTGTLPGGWAFKQVFRGRVDADLRVAPDGSSVVDHLGGFASFTVELHMFGFHSDELCAHHIGTLTPDAG